MMLKGLISIGLAMGFLFAVVSSTGAAPTEPLAQVIEGAKKEGTVLVEMLEKFTPNSIGRLKKEIRETFGVTLNIQYTPTTSFGKHLAQAVMERKSGVTPSHDVVALSTTYIAQGNNFGVLERVDWKPLITKETNPDVVHGHPLLRGAITYYTTDLGLMYNPEKVKAYEVPKTLSDLANPKWNGKVGINVGQSSYARRAFIMGKAKVLADLRGILRNNPIQGKYYDILNRYLIGEVVFGYIDSTSLGEARDKGMPAAWQDLDYAEQQYYALTVRSGAAHPNAAKLLAVYLASPAGAKFTLEEGKAGNLFYPGNFEHDLAVQAKKQGIPKHDPSTYPGLLEFCLTDEFVQWQKEIDLVFKTGG